MYVYVRKLPIKSLKNSTPEKRKVASMKKNIVKNASKLSVILVLFLMLTLVFTLYQTSVNAYVSNMATQLDEDSPVYKMLDFDEMNSITAEAASISAFGSIYRVATTTADAKWWAASNSSSVDVSITSGTALSRSIQGGVVQHAARLDVEMHQEGDPEKASVDTKPTAAHTGDATNGGSKNGTFDTGYKNTPTNATTYVCWVYCHAGGNAAGNDGRAHCTLLVRTSDGTAPSINPTSATSLSTGDSSATEYWQTGNQVTVTDAGAGLGSISVTYYNLAGVSSTSTGLDWSAGSATSRTGSKTLTLPNEGRYVITAKDDVGNSASKTVWYYKSVITATVNNDSAGVAYVTTSSTSSGSSKTLNNRYGSQSYYLYASANDYYYFTGWKGTGGGASGTLGVGSYVDNKWRQTKTMDKRPKANTFTWEAQFAEIAPLVLNNGTASASGTRAYTFNYDGQPIELTLAVPSGYGGKIEFSGTTLANNKYNLTTTAPTYAGKYIATVTLTYSGSVIGTAEFDVTINAINVYAKPTFPANAPNGAENSKVYDGNKLLWQVNQTDWILGSESANNPVITADYSNNGLTFTTINIASGQDFVFNDKTVATNKKITVNATASISATIPNAASTLNADLAKSYIFQNSADEIKGTIAPKELVIASAGYGQCYDGTKAISSLNGYYINDTKITTNLKGKVYDAHDTAYFAGIIMTGYVTGDDIGFSTDKAGSNTYYKTKSNETVSGTNNVGSILQSFLGTFANIDAGEGKTVTSCDLFLSGTDYRNYYVRGIATNNNATAYVNQAIKVYQEGCAIAQKDVTIAILSHVNKVYDGNTTATVTYGWAPAEAYVDANSNGQYDNGETFTDANGNGRWDDGSSPIQTNASGIADNLYPKCTDAVATFNSASANYYNGKKAPSDGRYLKEAKYISATGVAIALGSATDPSVKPNTVLENYHLTKTTTDDYRGAAYSDANYADGTFIAITTRLLNLTLVTEGKVFDGNNICYDNAFSWVSDEYEGDVGKIKITATVTYSTSQASIDVLTTARDISITSDDNTHKNYHLNEDSNGFLEISDANKVAIQRKDISGSVVDAIPSVYYSGSRYVPTTTITDKTLIDATDITKNVSRVLVVGVDFSYSYVGDFTNRSAGEAFADANANGIYDEGESFVDDNGNGVYDGDNAVNEHRVVITGTGNYTGSTYTIFTIKQASVYIDGVNDINIIYGQTLSTGKYDAEDGATGDIVANTIINLEYANAETFVDANANGTYDEGEEFVDRNLNGAYDSIGAVIPVYGSWAYVTSISSNAVVPNRPYVADSGIKTIQFTPANTWNYAIPATNVLTLTVNRRDIEITASEQKLEFGSDIKFNNTSMSYSAYDSLNHTGLISGDTFGTLNCEIVNMVYALPGASLADGKTICMVGSYDITNTDANGNVTIVNDNYNITYIGAKYTISKHAITIKAVETSKIYGEEDPYIDYSISSGSNSNVTKALIEGALSRNGIGTAVGEDASSFTSNLGTIGTSVFNTTNYNISFNENYFHINRRPVEIKPVDVTNHYFGEPITISQTAFTATAISGNDKSGIALRDKNIEVSELFTLLIIRTNPGLSQELLNTDLTNAQVGSYDLYIKTGINGANKNYVMTAKRGTFTIVPRPILITPNADQGKTYDGVGIAKNDTFSYTLSLNASGLTGSALVSGYPLTGALTRQDGADVNTYQIQQGTLNNDNGANSNYAITFSPNPVYYTIKQLDVTITPYEVTISVGDPLPDNSTLRFAVSPSSAQIVGGVMIEGSPEDVGKYNIVADAQMASSANSNYKLKVNGENKFIIEELIATVTPVAGQSDTFGNLITFGINEGQTNLAFTIVNKRKGIDLSHLLTGDDAEFSGSLSIDISSVLPQNDGESNADYHERKNLYLSTHYLPAGEYDIAIGSFEAKMHNGVTNYKVELETGVFVINKKDVTVQVPSLRNDGVTNNLRKIYDGQMESGIDYYINPADLVDGFAVDAESKLARDAGISYGAYAINIGNFNKLDKTNNKNYFFTLATNPDSGDGLYYYNIEKRNIVVTPVIPEGQDKISAVYGSNADTKINYTSVYKFDENEPGLIGNDTLGGALTRAPGKDVTEEGYEILIGTLNDSGKSGYNPNYQVSLDSKGIKYYITRREVKVTANSITGRNAQVFGDEPKTLSATATQGLVSGETLKGTPVRDEGITPGNYVIRQGSVNDVENPNYHVIFTEGTYTITARPLTFQALDGQKKGYTEADPVFQYEVSGGIVSGYDIDFTLTRVKGETVGKYNFVFVLEDNNICVNNSYYTFSQFAYSAEYGKRVFVDSKHPFSINRGQAVLGFNDATYADVDGNYRLDLEYDGTEQTVDSYLVVGGDEEYVDENGNGVYDEGEVFVDINENGVHDKAVNVTYRVNGKAGRTFKNAGTYTVEITAQANDNFQGTKAVVTVTVKPRNLGTINPVDMLEASDLTKVYDDEDDSNFSFKITTAYGDEVIATMIREEGEDVGKYDLTSISIDNTNYELVFEEGTNLDVYEITARHINVVPTAKSIGYGTVLSTWEETVTDDHGNPVVITYTRTDASNNNANTYDIESYVIDSTNHVVTIEDTALVGKFVITKRIATVKAVANTKTFDGTPIDLLALEYTVTGMANDELPVGSLTIVADGELDLVNVGKYTITAVGFDNASNSNYEMTYVPATFEIKPATIIISPVAVSYEYGEEILPFDYTIQSGMVFAGYPLEGSLGEPTNKTIGEWEIPQGTLNNEEGRNRNYQIQYLSGDIRYTITKRDLKIKVSSAGQVYGDKMADIEYVFIEGTSLVEGDELHGSLSATGYDVGTYGITLGELPEMNPNYNITLDSEGAIYTITPRPVTITPQAKSVAYGEAPLALTYDDDNLVNGDVLEGELGCELGTDVGTYAITQGTLYHKNYEITFVEGVVYEITAREITVTINNAESEYGEEDAELTYSITKGNLIGNDDLQVTLVRESGSEMGTYEISGSHNNANYSVTFINGTYTIKKFKAVITVESQYISFVEDGIAREISATCSSGAEITYTIDLEEVHNFFKNAGKYVVVLSAPETENYYAPDSVTVYITINRPFIQSEANGIDIKLESADGFDPTMSVSMSRLPADFEDIQAELKSNQKIVRAFTLTATSDQSSTEVVPGKTTVTIKVPNALQEEKSVKVMVQEDGAYNLVDVDVIDGYVTIEVDSLSSFAFIAEESNNYLLLIIIGVAALIMLGSVMVFLFRKRA